MTSKDTILMRYETLCGQLSNFVTVLELIGDNDALKMETPLIGLTKGALKQLISEHEELTSMYRKELTEDD